MYIYNICICIYTNMCVVFIQIHKLPNVNYHKFFNSNRFRVTFTKSVDWQ